MTTNKKNWKLACGCTGIIALAICGILALMFGTPLILPDTPGVEAPRVQIRLPSHGVRLSAMESQVVMLQAYSIKSVARYELWVDGNLVAYQAPSAGQTGLPTTSRLLWLPGQPGIYTLVGRVYDAQGRGGTSAPVVVEAVAEEAHCWDGLVITEVEVRAGDTIAAIAYALGSNVECILEMNPELNDQFEPGMVIRVPVLRENMPPEYVDEETQPPVDGVPPGEPFPQGQGEEPGQNAGDPGPDNLPAGGDEAGGAPPVAPLNLALEYTGECNVYLTWMDTSGDETGFRIYRMNVAREPFRVIGEVGPDIVEYDDVAPTGGQYEYYVSSVGAGGEAPGPIVAIDVPRETCFPHTPMAQMNAAIRLQFEATSLYTNSQFDGVHCYLSLARLQPDARLPESDDLEFAPHNGGWNIAAHASGFRRFIFSHDPAEPVPVEIECWGRRGRESELLGTFMLPTHLQNGTAAR